MADTALGVDANVELELEGAGNAAERIVARREIAEPQAHVLSCLEIERVGPKTKAHDPHVGRRRGYVEDGGLAAGRIGHGTLLLPDTRPGTNRVPTVDHLGRSRDNGAHVRWGTDIS